MFKQCSWYKDLPDESLRECPQNIWLFYETMYERQMIWKRRFIDKQERPWTDDKIFRESKFTNVYRELDRNSQWQIKNILLDDGLDLKNLIWKMMVFRFFNNPETFTFKPKANLFYKYDAADKWRNGIPDYEEYDEDEFAHFIEGVRENGQNPYTTAYLINSAATPGKTRDYCYTRKVIPTLHEKIGELMDVVFSAKQPEEIISYLKTLPAVADFIAHEFYQDFTYIPRYTNREFMKFTQNDYTNVGPGASIGIRLLFPSLATIREQKQAIYLLQERACEMLGKIERKRGADFPYLHWDKEERKYYTGGIFNITLHQIEMWLCEFQKYWKMTIGKGKQRSKFVPRTKALFADKD